MSEDRRTIRNWASRLSAADEPLSLEEASLLAAISANDRLVELLGAMQDVQVRLTRLEVFAAATIPGYDEQTRSLANFRETRAKNH